MKKLFVILLCLALAAGLCACGTPEPDPSELNMQPLEPVEETPSVGDIMAASESTAAAIVVEAPASDTDAEVDEAAYETAQTFIGRPVEELYAELGEPAQSQYAASCEEEDAEDGMLFYDGFYVWTVKTETEELIHDVYLMD